MCPLEQYGVIWVTFIALPNYFNGGAKRKDYAAYVVSDILGVIWGLLMIFLIGRLAAAGCDIAVSNSVVIGILTVVCCAVHIMWDVPRNEIIAPETPEIAAENRRHTIPGYVVLIDHPKLGKILYDTGCAQDWGQSWNSQMKSIYTWHSQELLTDKLAELGLTAADIDILIISHLHYDHAGNIRLFAGTKAGQKIIVSRQEAQKAFVNVNLDNSGYAGAYWKSEFLDIEGIGYQLIDKDTKLADDLELFIQVGHTPGVIGMILKTEKDGNFILTSDAIYSSNNFGPPVVLPGLCVDPVSYRANIEWVAKTSKALNAKILFSHDVEDFKSYKKSPEWYE